MGKEKNVGPGLGVLLLASAVFASLYFMGRVVVAQDTYFYTFSQQMDKAIADAYGIPFVH